MTPIKTYTDQNGVSYALYAAKPTKKTQPVRHISEVLLQFTKKFLSNRL